MRGICVVLLGIGAVTTGCDEPKAGPDARVTTTLSASTLRAGETVQVTVTVVNTGSESETINANECPMKFDVRTPAGAIVGPAGEVCDLSLRIKTLAPGESYAFSYQWNGSSREAHDAGTPAPPLPAGSYLIRGLVAFSLFGPVPGNSVELSITP